MLVVDSPSGILSYRGLRSQVRPIACSTQPRCNLPRELLDADSLVDAVRRAELHPRCAGVEESLGVGRDLSGGAGEREAIEQVVREQSCRAVDVFDREQRLDAIDELRLDV